MAISEPPSAAVSRSWRQSVALALRIVQVRLRFPIVLLIAFLAVGKWTALRGWWDRLTLHEKKSAAAVSLDTEYWCPMCPGVLSDWPIKCPVCNMGLVRRKKGEMAPLPSGILARMQFSPYRIQLAGIQTAPVEYRILAREVVVLGRVERTALSTRVPIAMEVYGQDMPFLVDGAPVEVLADSGSGRPPLRSQLRLADLTQSSGPGPLMLTVTFDDPRRELQAGSSVTARIKSIAGQWDSFREDSREEWSLRTAFDQVARSCFGLGTEAGLEPLGRAASQMLLRRGGYVAALPDTAVVDTGSHKVVYVETAPGTFDAIEVVVGPRCGDAYPLVRGPEVGQRVATAGAFLLDAETRLNPSVAASYFGATRSADAEAARRPSGPVTASASAEIEVALAKLTLSDRKLAEAQKLCPVTGEPLGSMGVPVRIEVLGKTVFLCCKGCEGELRRNAEKYLKKGSHN